VSLRCVRISFHKYGIAGPVLVSLLAFQLFLLAPAAGQIVTRAVDRNGGETGTGSISGHVLDQDTLEPVASSTVVVRAEDGSVVAITELDSSGGFSFPGLTLDAAYYVQTYLTTVGYVDELFDDIPCMAAQCNLFDGKKIVVTSSQPHKEIDLLLNPRGGRVSGRVVDRDTNEPVQNIRVQVFSEVGPGTVNYVGEGVTDEQGRYTTGTGLVTGSYFARTLNEEGYFNKAWGNETSCQICPPATGKVFPVDLGETKGGIDFSLRRGGRIAGVVRDSRSGEGLAGVEVWVERDIRDRVSKGLTDANGRYVTGQAIPPGTYYLRTFNRIHYINQVYDGLPCTQALCPLDGGKTITIRDSETVEGADFSLDAGGIVEGRVVDENSGRPIKDVFLLFSRADGSGYDGFRTDDTGHYQSDVGIAEGTYFARTYNSSTYADELYDNKPCPNSRCDPTAGDPITVRKGETTEGIDFALQDTAGTISGSVRDGSSHAPLTGVRIRIYEPSGRWIADAMTDGDGHYVSKGLTPGSYFVRTDNTLGYFNQLYDGVACQGGCDVTQGAPVVVNERKNTGGIDFSLERGGRISGRVVSKDGTVIPSRGVSVIVYPKGGNAAASVGFVDGDGHYVTEAGLPEGDYYVRTNNEAGYVDLVYPSIYCTGNCNVAAIGEPVHVEKGEIVNGIDFQLEEGTTLSGSFEDTETGEPLEGIRVNVMSVDGEWINSTDMFAYVGGGFRSRRAWPPGKYFIRTRNTSGFVDQIYDGIECSGTTCDTTAATTLTFSEGRKIEGIRFSLRKGGSVRGRVVDAVSGSPIEGLPVELRTKDGHELYLGLTADDGSFGSESGLLPGHYSIVTLPHEEHPGKVFGGDCYWNTPGEGTEIEVTAGQVVEGIEVAVDPGGSLGGTVRERSSGRGIADVRIQLNRLRPAVGGGAPADGFTSAQGAFQIRNVCPGDYILTTTNQGGFIDQLYEGIDCPLGKCDTTAGRVVHVANNRISAGIDFLLDKGARIEGKVVAEGSGLGIGGGGGLFNREGEDHAATLSVVEEDGTFVSGPGLPPGRYQVRTWNNPGFLEEDLAGLACEFGECLQSGNRGIIELSDREVVGGTVFRLGEAARITGRVFDGETQDGVANARMLFVGAGGEWWTSSRSGEDGSYQSPDLYAGTVKVRATETAPFFESEFVESRGLSPGETRKGVDFRLTRGGMIEGAVSEAETGRALEGIEVHVLDTNGHQVTQSMTGPDGAYSSSKALKPGRYFVRVFDNDLWINELFDDVVCLTSDSGCSLERATALRIEGSETVRGIDFSLKRGSVIEGTVVDSETGAPLKEVGVVLLDPLGTFVHEPATGADGSYKMFPVGPGEFFLATENWIGYVDQTFDGNPCLPRPTQYGCELDKATPIVTDGVSTYSADFRLSRGGVITGEVALEPDGGVPEDSWVAVLDSSGGILTSVSCDSDGTYRTNRGLPVGDYYVKASAPEAVDELWPDVQCETGCDVRDGDVIKIDEPGEVVEGIDFSLALGGFISGSVVDMDTGKALPGAIVLIYDGEGTLENRVQTNQAGEYRSRALAAGSYFVASRTSAEYEDQVYDGIPCGMRCNPSVGEEIRVLAGNTTKGIDLHLRNLRLRRKRPDTRAIGGD